VNSKLSVRYRDTKGTTIKPERLTSIRIEIEMIAHSCGVDHPHDLTRDHLMIVQANGRSRPFSQTWDMSRYM